MAKVSNREKILCEGMKVVHAHGFGNASVRDIVGAAGVPQGSFTNHFASKEEFGLEVMNRYFEMSKATLAETLRNDALPPLARFKKYMEMNTNGACVNGMKNGCLFGNFAAETSDFGDPLRERLVEVFEYIRDSIAYCLKAAVKAGEINPSVDCDEVAGFIVSSLQGATLLSKTQRSAVPLERMKKVIFTSVLNVKI